MNISEIYVCSQGEGPLVGVPSILVRTSGCNLRCRWKNQTTGKVTLCDSWFTSWKPEQKETTPQAVYEEIIKLATTYPDGKKRDNNLTNVIISGGEPTEQKKDVQDLTSALIFTGLQVTLEINGTNYIEVPTKLQKDGQDLTGRIICSISPKLSSSTPVGTRFEKQHEKKRINLVVLEALLKRYPAYLKFVVSSEKDIEEIQEIQKALKCAPSYIYLMAEGIKVEDILERGRMVNELCIKHGYRYSPREHILLYGNKRGT